MKKRRPAARASNRARSGELTLDARLSRVKLFLCDVDGVLTDGTVLMGDGKEYKTFHIQDGLGLRLLQQHGIKVGWVSNRPSEATRQRAEDLKVDYLFQGKGNKIEAVESILKEAKVAWSDVSYMGDDVVDLGALKRAGLAVTVANGIAEAKAMAHYVTRAHGGRGAVRELVDMLLKAKNLWAGMIADFSA